MNNLLKKAIVMGLGALGGIVTLSATRIDDGAWFNKKDDDDNDSENNDKITMPDITEEAEKFTEEDITIENVKENEESK